jgi:hemoglobin
MGYTTRLLRIYFSEDHSATLLSSTRKFGMQPAEKPSLHDRLGGVYSIATILDEFIDGIMADLRLNGNPLVDEAHCRVPPAGFKYLVTGKLCWVAGGPQKCIGKPMAESHARLKITIQERESFLNYFQQTLEKFAVQAQR